MTQSDASCRAAASPFLLVGTDTNGMWVVLDRGRHCIGVFAGSKDAIHFAIFESERKPQAVIVMPDRLEGDGARALMLREIRYYDRPHRISAGNSAASVVP